MGLEEDLWGVWVELVDFALWGILGEFLEPEEILCCEFGWFLGLLWGDLGVLVGLGFLSGSLYKLVYLDFQVYDIRTAYLLHP